MPQNHISKDEIHVWQATPSAELAAVLLPVLSRDECARASRFRQASDAQRFVTARGVLRTVLGQYLDQPARNVQICYGQAGKPALAVDAALQFNVSHSAEMVLVAISRQRAVGVDVEHISPMLDFEPLADHFFFPTEKAAIEMAPVYMKRRAFFLTWSRKEALLKAQGEGLPALPNLCPMPAVANSFFITLRVVNQKSTEWVVSDLSVGSHYAAAVAAEGATMRVTLRQWAESWTGNKRGEQQ